MKLFLFLIENYHAIYVNVSFSCVFLGILEEWSPTFLAPGVGIVERSFSMDRGGDGFRMIQAHYMYCALYFCYYYINSTSDHQAVDPRGLGPLTYRTLEKCSPALLWVGGGEAHT